MADQKLTALVEETSPATGDLLYLVDDPGGAPISKKATVANVVAAGIPDIGCRVYHDANQSIANNTSTILALNSERWDTSAFHDTVTNNSRLTIPSGYDGKYLIIAQVQWAQSATARRATRIKLNGATYIAIFEDTPDGYASGYPGQIATTIYDLSATDYVEIEVYQLSGGALNVNTSANLSPEFMLQKIG